MFLTAEEEAVLAGEEGPTRQQLMEILVAMGKVFEAEKMVPIRSAQVSGASYKTIGRWGLEWLSSLDAKASVPAILNPVGMDRIRWKEMEIDPVFAKNQLDVIAAYERLGIRLECTCTPYYLTITEYGDHLAWSESSAVAYANSVIGARTNREGGPSALAAAILGRTPAYGLHLVENRSPVLSFHVEDAPEKSDESWYGALGYLAGKIAGNRVPIFTGIRPSRDQLKNLGAAMAATGATALYHVQDITPEARVFKYDTSALESITITASEVADVYSSAEPDAVAIGCPHCSDEELTKIAEKLQGCRVKKPLYIFAAKGVITRSAESVGIIEKSGARVFADTCMVVSPALEQYKTIMVSSGKALAYVPNMCGAASVIGTLDDCLSAACR
ncbi:MAG TPA: aconitase X catalytic domain-containing protein [Methanospirillum sp.]|uniref:aconitase X catalytic domain-containing protein n=1 Tax=Methanospirillum sp. TaxID=45200 RepID=UPI002BA6AC21|nr:aconitase X catalytic domain-containing protein [Methanospirillum sp.]HWQ63402.1 aconitase X catalytic domain-containing protein [Methanospirillum sp.]